MSKLHKAKELLKQGEEILKLMGLSEELEAISDLSSGTSDIEVINLKLGFVSLVIDNVVIPEFDRFLRERAEGKVKGGTEDLLKSIKLVSLLPKFLQEIIEYVEKDIVEKGILNEGHKCTNCGGCQEDFEPMFDLSNLRGTMRN